MERILQIKDRDWMRGLGYQGSSTVGGIFSGATNFDPFEVMEMMQPSLAGTAATGDALNTLAFLTPISTSGVSYLYGHGTSKLFQITSGNVVTDITTASGVIVTSAVAGAIYWKSKYIYAIDNQVYANTIGTNTNTKLLDSLNTGVPHIFCVGADGNLYMTNGSQISKITSTAGTAGNSANAFADVDSGTVFKDLVNDGRYLVAIGDNNTGTALGKFRCIVGYWDMVKGNYDQLYDNNYIDDSYLIAAEIINGAIHIIGREGMYICSVNTPPTLVYDFTGNATLGTTALPNGPTMVTKRKGTLIWGYSGGGQVYGYGTPIPGTAKTFFQPYTATSGNITALAYLGSTLFAATSTPGLYALNSGTTRNISTITIGNIVFDKPYKFEYAKAVLRDTIASGQSIGLQLLSQNVNGIISTTKTYDNTSSPGKQTIIWERNPAASASDRTYFEELASIILTATKIGIERFEIWATALDDQTSEL